MSKLELTPTHLRNGIHFKREDLYAPYGDAFISGGKIRQCRDLVENNLTYIIEECDSTIATAASIHSPQSPIVSRVAQEFNLKSIIGFGNTTVAKSLRNIPMQWCHDMGSELVVLSESQGFNNVLYANLKKLQETRRFFPILFGYAAQTHRESIVDRISEQVKNIPTAVREVYVPVGSGVTLAGVLEGRRKYGGSYKIIGLQPFGYDRRSTVSSICEGMSWEYDYEFREGNYPYSKLHERVIGDIELDMIYESKAFDMVAWKGDETECFWIIGNTNKLRKRK
jgi:1-aminocyclopropane-1-carboxylate deaminase/D-cysteine desulfhydrase-like pyridoxal-dependent ACC family enzyme